MEPANEDSGENAGEVRCRGRGKCGRREALETFDVVRYRDAELFLHAVLRRRVTCRTRPLDDGRAEVRGQCDVVGTVRRHHTTRFDC